MKLECCQKSLNFIFKRIGFCACKGAVSVVTCTTVMWNFLKDWPITEEVLPQMELLIH